MDMRSVAVQTATAAPNGSYPGSQSPESDGQSDLPTAGEMMMIAVRETQKHSIETREMTMRGVEQTIGIDGQKLCCWCRRARRACSKVVIIGV